MKEEKGEERREGEPLLEEEWRGIEGGRGGTEGEGGEGMSWLISILAASTLACVPLRTQRREEEEKKKSSAVLRSGTHGLGNEAIHV